MLVTTNWLSMQSFMFAAGPSSTAVHGPAVKSDKTLVRAQKHSRLEMSRASVTPLRIVRFGVITRTRPRAMPNGSVAMIPVLPHPTGITMIAGSSDSAKCSRTARCASRCGSRSRSFTSMFAFAVVKISPSIVAASDARRYSSRNGSSSARR